MARLFSKSVLFILFCCLNCKSAKKIKCSDISPKKQGVEDVFQKLTLEIPTSDRTDILLTTVHLSGPEGAAPFTRLSLLEYSQHWPSVFKKVVKLRYVLNHDVSFLPPTIFAIDVATADQCISYCKGGIDYRLNIVYYNVSHTLRLIGMPDAINPNCKEYFPILEPLPKNCGLRPPTRLPIGQVVERESWPWLAAIYIRNRGSMRFRCGGSIISSRTILTAAHCVMKEHLLPYNESSIMVFTGRHNLSDLNEVGYRNHLAKQVVVHPGYEGTNQHDIAVINLATEIVFSSYAMPVCLTSDTDPFDGQLAFIAGWGVKKDGLPSRVPYLMATLILHPEVCGNSSEVYGENSLSSTICAENLDDFGPCGGDSGGGLILSDSNSRYSIRGLVSATLADAGTGQCYTEKYVLYTDVAKYYDWIRSELW